MEDGHEGGNLKVEYKGKEEHFASYHDGFFLSAYYNCCRHTMEPVTRGFKLTLVYSLLWKTAKMAGIPHDFPVFVTALNEVKKAFEPWIPKRTIEKETRQIEPLFFVLERKYEESDLGFHRLQGADQDLAHLLKYCLYLDVHLAMVTENHESKTKISRWIDSNDAKINLNVVEFDWEKQCVGPIGNLLKLEQNYRTILVIWPKHESLKMYCRHGLDSFLDRMIISLNWSCLCEQQNSREKAVEKLDNIISFCCDHPTQVWTDTKNGDLALKMLRLCTSLGAREEGLALLKVLGSGPPSCSTFEGIQTEHVARAIAEFECHVAGNKSLFYYFDF